MLQELPTELLCAVLTQLEYDDLDTLLQIVSIEPIVRHHVLRRYRFHYQVSSLLRLFESFTPSERERQESEGDLANQLLQLICYSVEKQPKFEHRSKFTELLDIMQYLVVRRILSPELRPGLEKDYASLCLKIRHIYLHTPSIRVLHDPKYRRRSTKYPLAPFLPRDYTWVWRSQCASALEVLRSSTLDRKPRLIRDRDIRLRFAYFFGSLFKLTSLYLESNLDGTFEECVREALVSGDVESLFVMCKAASKPVEVFEMCMVVTHAGEQLWNYLDTMEDWLATDPTPEQRARLERSNNEATAGARDGQDQYTDASPPEWLMPERYRVHQDTKLRLQLMKNLYQMGWRWYDTGVITACIAIPIFREIFSLNDDAHGAAAVVISLVSSLVASFASGFVADGMGRKKFFYVAAIFHIVGSIIQLVGNRFGALIVGRILTGATVGMLSMSVPLYQSEIASPQNRGRIITLYQLGVTVGYCLSNWIAYGTVNMDGHDAWRIPTGLQIMPSGLLLLGLFFVPESPRWLIARDEYDEALYILSLLRSRGNKQDTETLMEFTSIVQDVTFDRTFTSKKFQALFERGIENYQKRTLLGAGIHTFTQFTGFNALLFYFPRILRATGMPEVDAVILGSAVAGLVNMAGTLPVFFFIDRWDRKRILTIGALVMAACMVAVAALMGAFSTQSTPPQIIVNPSSSFDDISVYMRSDAATYAIMVLLCLFVAVYALSWGPAGWIYPAEIYPQLIRANAMGVTTASSYLFNLIITIVAPLLFESIQWGTYLLFGCFCICIAWVVHRFYPETRGRSLEEVNLIFSGALIDQRPGAHHPETAAEALMQLQELRRREERMRARRAMAQSRQTSFAKRLTRVEDIEKQETTLH
ncbi:hypothetical protein VTP01DRAFT_6958 [Rhizomucor pusillus]|uniref:uncharacterized protein n=1 Tax=Rhizomucor pusillus TaxID=4840 RepID=UPI0037438732